MNKNITLVALFFVLILPFSAKSQKNVVKLNLPSLGLSNIYLSYERVFTDRKTIAIDFSVLPSRSLPFHDAFTTSLKNNNADNNVNDLRYSHLKMSGFSIAPEFRFYASHRKEAPRGFYIAPYVKYQNFGLKGNYSNTSTDNNGNTTTGYFVNSGSYSVFGAGARIGAQWLIADRFSIDWTIIGLGLGSYMFDLKETATGEGPNYYTPGNNSLNTTSSWPSHTYTYTNNSGELKIHALLPQLTMRLFVGIAF